MKVGVMFRSRVGFGVGVRVWFRVRARFGGGFRVRIRVGVWVTERRSLILAFSRLRWLCLGLGL